MPVCLRVQTESGDGVEDSDLARSLRGCQARAYARNPCFHGDGCVRVRVRGDGRMKRCAKCGVSAAGSCLCRAPGSHSRARRPLPTDRHLRRRRRQRRTTMFDPLSTTFGEDPTPPWPTTPRTPNTPIPNMPRPSTPRVSSRPQTPDKLGSGGLYGKQPQIYGQPEPGLISPNLTVGSNGAKYEKNEPYLRVRITGMDRNRRDILVKFDAQVWLVFPRMCHCVNGTCRVRRTCPTLQARRTATSRARTSSSSSSTTRSYTTTRRLSSLLCRSRKHLRLRMRRMIGWSRSCYNDG